MRQHLISHICFCYLNCVSVIFCFVLQIAGGGCFWSKIIGGRFNVSCFRLHKYQGTISWPRTFIFLIDGNISGIMAFTFYRLSDWLDKITSFTHFHLSFYLFIIFLEKIFILDLLREWVDWFLAKIDFVNDYLRKVLNLHSNQFAEKLKLSKLT